MNTIRCCAVAGCALITGISALALLVNAGPLNPPAGPVSPTAKTLAEIEPRIVISLANTPGDADSLFKITQPGSYYLTGNITGVGGKIGIEIANHGVTLDLNGFELAGIPGSLDGVRASIDSLRNIVVINGNVRDWDAAGIYLGTAASGRLERVNAWRNGTTGLSAGSGMVISHCSAHANAGSGISAGFGCSITDCSAYSNASNGISAGSANTVTNCAAYFSGANGFTTGSVCTVTNCAAYNSGTRGFLLSIGSTISACSAGNSGSDGIRCSTGCFIINNTCYASGIDDGDGAGVRATGGDNRIEGNNCTGADRGIDIDQVGNVIVRNTCAGNTVNYVIAVDNIYGAIIDRRIPTTVVTTPSVNGSAATGTMGSTDPHANFSY